VEYPGRSAGVFAVSVVEPNDTFPTDSVNRGPGIDLLAPGDGVPILLRGGGATASAQATSYSTPFAAGAAALIKQANPKLTATQIASILTSTGANVKDTSTGFAFSGRTYKRLNVYQAVKSALATVTTTPSGSIAGVVFNDADGDGAKARTEKKALATILYLDTNNDGVRQSTEPLTSSSPRSGNYAFLNLAAGTYRVREVAPAGYRQTLPASSYTVTLTSSQAVMGMTFGNTVLGLISGTVFNDLNVNGLQGAGEGGLAGWQVYLDNNGDGKHQRREPAVLSDASGAYFFAVPAGTYLLRIAPQAGWSRTTAKAYSIPLASGGVSKGWIFGEKS